MKIKNLKFGYEVVDCNLSSHEAKYIPDLIAAGRFVIIRNPGGVDPNKLADFYHGVGNVAVQSKNVRGSGIDGRHELIRVRKDGMFAGSPGTGRLDWHNCGLNRKDYDHIVAMYMHQPAIEGGDTGFTDARTAFHDLSDEFKDKLRNIKVINRFYKLDNVEDFSKNPWAAQHKNFTESWQVIVNADGKRHIDKQVKEADLVNKHVWDDREGIYFPWIAIEKIKGLDKDKSIDFMKRLKAHCLSDKYVYIHKWQKGDIIFSDQIQSLHARFPYRGERELWRAGMNYKL